MGNPPGDNRPACFIGLVVRMTESIVLFGGEKDGMIIEVGAHPPFEWLIPVPLTDNQLLDKELDFDRPDMPVGVYAPRVDRLGVVQCDLAGHPIYEWKGVRG